MTIATTIRWIKLTLPQSSLQDANPLPHFTWQQPIQSRSAVDNKGLNAEESKGGFFWGMDSILPYQVQDQYGREQIQQEMSVIEICNGRLCCLVAPHLGGRMLSLKDIRLDRELLFANSVFQPANLGSLNAWFSGGIEWNGLIPGHTPFTCAPVFSGVVNTTRGAVLRFYEFDRIVEASWQIDLFLPNNDDRLFVHGRIVNPDTFAKQAYWWLNIAVPATPGMRVLSPADYSIEHVLPDNQLERREFPNPSKPDGSYPQNWVNATSVFFRAPEAKRLWISALDSKGSGLTQVATSEMRGRKFFYFGTGKGGSHWMDYLSQTGKGNYVEIQSGITPTQNQRFDLPAQTEIHWTEGLACLHVDVALAHANDYQQAVASTQMQVEARFPADELQEIDHFMREVSSQKITYRMSEGAPWGARQERGMGRIIASGLDFELENHSPSAWDELIDNGHLSDAELSKLPEGFAVSSRWLAILRESAKVQGETWLHSLMLGIAELNDGKTQKARERFERSLVAKPNWLAYRQMALVARDDNEAIACYRQAAAQADAPPALAIEIANYLLTKNHTKEAENYIASLPTPVKGLERIQLAMAKIAERNRNWTLLAQLLEGSFATIREGENLLSDLWLSLQHALSEAALGSGITKQQMAKWMVDHPVPQHLDFRMHNSETLNGTCALIGKNIHGKR